MIQKRTSVRQRGYFLSAFLGFLIYKRQKNACHQSEKASEPPGRHKREETTALFETGSKKRQQPQLLREPPIFKLQSLLDSDKREHILLISSAFKVCFYSLLFGFLGLQNKHLVFNGRMILCWRWTSGVEFHLLNGYFSTVFFTLTKKYLFGCLIYLFGSQLWLTESLVIACKLLQLWHVGCCSLTRD